MKMVFEKVVHETCPKILDQWQANGFNWTIQILPPEDDVEAVQILKHHLCPDETMCIEMGMYEDPVSLKSMGEFWMMCLSKRTSLACYAEKDGTRTLAGLNVCLVEDSEAKEVDQELVKGESWQNVYKTLVYMESKLDTLQYLGVDKQLIAMGLVVRREYRGQRLGVKLLQAREPLCRWLGISATSTVFTSVASQKTAARSGFTTVVAVSLRELADSGLNYPRDENRFLKVMVKKYD